MKSRYRSFSFARIGAITANTLTELTRLRVFYVLLVFALVLIGSSIFMAQFSFQQEFQILKDISLGAISIFTSLLAIIATASPGPRRSHGLHDPRQARAPLRIRARENCGVSTTARWR
jgi:hypothetical protein